MSIVSYKTYIVVKTTFDGTHYWKDASNFLKHEHHHQFHIIIKVRTIPGDMDRVLEFFEVRKILFDAIDTLYPKDELDIHKIGTKSCEAIADDIYSYTQEEIRKQLSLPAEEVDMTIQVLEDGYAGAEAVYQSQ